MLSAGNIDSAEVSQPSQQQEDSEDSGSLFPPEKSEGFFLVRSFASVSFGAGKAFRGGGKTIQFLFNAVYLNPGISLRIEWDSVYEIAVLPLSLVIGIGPNFWISFGHTFPINYNDDGTAGQIQVELNWTGFVDTYGFGFAFDLYRKENWLFGMTGEISYTYCRYLDRDNQFLTHMLYGVEFGIGLHYSYDAPLTLYKTK